MTGSGLSKELSDDLCTSKDCCEAGCHRKESVASPPGIASHDGTLQH